MIVTVARSYGRHYPYLHLDVQEDMRRLSDFASPADRELSELGERFDRAMDAIVRERMRRGDLRVDVDPTMARFVIVGAVNWTQRWFVPGGRLDGGQVGEELCARLLHGLLARPGG